MDKPAASSSAVETIARDALDDDDDTTRVVDHAAERSLCFKFDGRILPVLSLIYMFNALDKANLSNAETNGLSSDLNLKQGQYNLVVSVLFIPHVVFAPPFAMLAKKYGPARALPVMMFAFGSVTLLTAATQNFGGLFAVRWLLGMAEAAVFPTGVYYLTTFYRRGELARRLAVVFAASNMAHAFSGLLASAVFSIKSGMYSWRYLFLIEGSLTVLFAVFAYWYLPSSAAQASFLSQEEKALAFRRIQVDSSSVVSEEFSLRQALGIFKYPSSYAFLAIEVCLGVPLQATSLFLPQIIQRLGYSPVRTNLYTVAPNVVGAAVPLVLAFASDYRRTRFPFVALGFALTCVGYVIYAALGDVQAQIRVAYFATFLMRAGVSVPPVFLSAWYNNNIAHEGRRVALASVGGPLEGLMGLVASSVFQKRDAPKYMPALITAACFGAAGGLVTGLVGLYMVLDNKRRDRKAGLRVKAHQVPTAKLRDGPGSPEFRWYV
ncbi:uncharacterized protein UV8b_00866 [Ustilaginoidea virens]|uniref:Major facilitator superfamily (MFS) profile domain-containing protein n=1 Tax=Ustilaginoidea virens TaxID=1159556 RepID=A0A8E5HJK4_USTVR|nr:uncharacterized protein UV8b_00866 [Ustilaginoidea virens]QUC16625.1 hypothetical protein UV8b_00866 [Ustilaginoidea virens]